MLKVEEKLSKGWGGENAYHVGGYRYLLVDGDRNVSRASPPGKVMTLTKVCTLLLFSSTTTHFDLFTCKIKSLLLCESIRVLHQEHELRRI